MRLKVLVATLLVTAVSVPLYIMTTGFDYSKHSIDTDEILSGGPPKDGIPSISDPKFIAASEATFLKDSDKVMGVVISNGKGDVAKAYPIKILNWHEAVNDEQGPLKFLVTW